MKLKTMVGPHLESGRGEKCTGFSAELAGNSEGGFRGRAKGSPGQMRSRDMRQEHLRLAARLALRGVDNQHKKFVESASTLRLDQPVSPQILPDPLRLRLPIQVLSEHPLAAKYLLNTLSSHPELRGLLARPPTSGFNLVAETTSPRLFIVDTYSLPLELLKVARHLAVCCPGSRFLGLLPAQGCKDEDILRILYLGLDGVVITGEGFEEEVVPAVDAILAGGLWAPRRILAEYVRQTNWLRSDQFFARFSLTPRESQVLQLVLRRLSNKEIAGALRISERTVKFHVSNILGKLQVEDRQGLAAAVGATLVEVPSDNSVLVPLAHAIA